jgi:hypothetical protein
MTRGWPETGFLRKLLVTGVDMEKNPVSTGCDARAHGGDGTAVSLR